MNDGNVRHAPSSGGLQDKKSDEELMNAYQHGDIQGFETLYGRYSPRVYGYLRNRLSDRSAVDDVFQAIFLKLHNARQQYDPALPFKPWLFSICHAVLVDRFRADARHPETVELEEDHAHTSPNEKEQLVVNLDSLSVDQRNAIELRYFEEHSFEEIAKQLSKTPAGVRQLVSRGIRRLNQVLNSKEGK